MLETIYGALAGLAGGCLIVGVGRFAAMTVVSLAGAAAVVVLWRPDHFKPGREVLSTGRHPVVRVLGLLAKNFVGYVLVVLGVVMSLPGVPGQGLLTILIGLT